MFGWVLSELQIIALALYWMLLLQSTLMETMEIAGELLMESCRNFLHTSLQQLAATRSVVAKGCIGGVPAPE